MLDRVPTMVLPNGAIRYAVFDEAGNFLRHEYMLLDDEPTQEGNPINKNTLAKDATLALYGLPTSAVPDEVLVVAHGSIAKVEQGSLVRDLNIMLNLSLGTSNIDAWADLLANTSRINTSLSSGYAFSAGKINTVSTGGSISATSATGSNFMGRSSYISLAQTFKTGASHDSVIINSITVKLGKTGSPTDAVKVCIYSTVNGIPVSQIAESTNTVSGSSIPAGFTDYVFNFNPVMLLSGQTYALVVRRTGALNDSNHYTVSCASNGAGPYADGTMCEEQTNGNFIVSARNTDLYFSVSLSSRTKAIILWNPVVSTETFVRMAIAASAVFAGGEIMFYASHDGTTWTQITGLNASQAVSFVGTAVHVRVEIRGAAELRSIAWGGY